MKRTHLFALAFGLAAAMLALPGLAFAESSTSTGDWTVTFNSAGQMEDSFASKQWTDDIGGLQPGDDITLTVNLSHENAQEADWYVSNEVLKSLEAGTATGSAYEYRLAYVNPQGTERVLYDSATVGGEDSQGLLEATSSLEDYLYLDRLTQGQKAHMTLRVGLDGETEGNAYFNTLAQLKMRFAVEVAAAGSGSSNNATTTSTRANDPAPNRNIVRTGDDTNLFPFYVAMSVSGILLALIAAYMVIARRRQSDRSN